MDLIKKLNLLDVLLTSSLLYFMIFSPSWQSVTVITMLLVSRKFASYLNAVYFRPQDKSVTSRLAELESTLSNMKLKLGQHSIKDRNVRF